jgi:hypothetical protein
MQTHTYQHEQVGEIETRREMQCGTQPFSSIFPTFSSKTTNGAETKSTGARV